MKKTDLVLVGVGGQGIILASDIIGEAAMAAGLQVKKTDMMGMAQRGGSVVSHVRIGESVASPLIEKGRVDIMLAFEKLEACRYVDLLRSGGVAIVGNQSTFPLSVSSGGEHYPTDEEVRDVLRQRTDRFFFVDGNGLAKKVGNIRTANIALLGFLSQFMDLQADHWRTGLERCVKPAFLPVNLEAFNLGIQEAVGQAVLSPLSA